MTADAELSRRIDAASERLAKEPADAARRAQSILERAPQDPRAALILASARRRLGDAPGALSLLVPLAQRYPDAAMTHYELGLALADGRQFERAIAALRHALTRAPRLGEAWRALGELLFRVGDERGARAAFASHQRTSITQPALAPAADALLANRPEEAERLLRAHLTAYLDDLDALRLLAFTVSRQARDAEAEALFALYLQRRPADDGARFGYAEVLFRRTKGAAALQQVEALSARKPAEAAYRNLLAACCAQIGDWARALALYEALLAEYDRQPRIWLNYGHALRSLRRITDAQLAYRRAIALRPGFGEPYWSLANLKTRPFTPDEHSAMHAALRSVADVEDELHLRFALGKALEDRGDYAESFEYYARGAAIRRRQVEYDPRLIARRVLRHEQVFGNELLRRAAPGAEPDPPIFIVGLPRSGSTLVEQILASHPDVEGTFELPDLGHLVEELTARATSEGSDYPQILARLDREPLRALAQTYLERTRVHRRLGRPRFIDKMPTNFLHVGLIHLVFPGASIVDVRRHPLGACFSAFKQHFAQGHAFSYDLTELGQYYRHYVDLMRHFDGVLPGRVHRVIYEDLVQDLEGEVRRLLDYCRLPFDPACLTFHVNPRPVRTVSSEQVRRPIYTDGLARWRAFEPWLDPLKSALGSTLENWR